MRSIMVGIVLACAACGPVAPLETVGASQQALDVGAACGAVTCAPDESCCCPTTSTCISRGDYCLMYCPPPTE